MIERDLGQLVYGYFASERETALTGGVVGIICVVAAFILWARAGMAPFHRGLAYPLLIAGVLLIGACTIYASTVERRGVSLVAEYLQKSVEESLALEEARMSDVAKHGYNGAFAIFTMSIVGGAAMLFFYFGAPFRKGIACGLVVVGLMGFTLEGFSLHKNRQYLQTLRSEVLGSASAGAGSHHP